MIDVPTEVLGNNLNPLMVKILKNRSEVALRFSAGKITEYGRKVERKLKLKYETERSKPDYGGNILVHEGEILRRKSHDCGDSCCPGLSDIFYISGEELERIANSKS